MAGAPRVSLRGLRTFCVAATHENFREAGEELFITASAVSHQIKSLEQELGVQLFERSSRDLKLTNTGRALHEEVSPLLAKIGDITASYKSGPKRSKLKISVQPFFASEFFVPRLSEFTEQNPDIDIQVGTSDESAEKHPADADLSIRLFKNAPDNMPSRKLFPLCMVAAGSKDFKKSQKIKQKKIVGDFPIIVHEARPKAWKQWQKATGISLPEDSKVTRLDSMIAVVRAAEQGIGAALVPVPIADQWFEQKTLVRLYDQEIVADVSYFLVWQEERALDESVVLLRDWILEKFVGQR